MRGVRLLAGLGGLALRGGVWMRSVGYSSSSAGGGNASEERRNFVLRTGRSDDRVALEAAENNTKRGQGPMGHRAMKRSTPSSAAGSQFRTAEDVLRVSCEISGNDDPRSLALLSTLAKLTEPRQMHFLHRDPRFTQLLARAMELPRDMRDITMLAVAVTKLGTEAEVGHTIAQWMSEKFQGLSSGDAVKFLQDLGIRVRRTSHVVAVLTRLVPLLPLETVTRLAGEVLWYERHEAWDTAMSRPLADLLDAMLKRVAPHASQIDREALMRVIRSVTAQRYKTPEFFAAVTPTLESRVNLSELAYLVWASAELASWTPDASRLAASCIQQGLKGADALAKLAWAICFADETDSTTMHLVIDRMNRLGRAQFSVFAWPRIYMVHLALQSSKSTSAPRLSDLLVAEADKVWQMTHMMKSKSSRQHARVSRLLYRAGVDHAVEHVEEHTKFVLDIFLVWEGQLVAIENDGPWHFTSNNRGFGGETLLKRRLLAARGVRVISVPFSDHYMDDRALLRSILDKLALPSTAGVSA